MLEQTDLSKSGDLMKEIIKGQQQFFNGQQGKTDQGGQESTTTPERSPSKDSI